MDTEEKERRRHAKTSLPPTNYFIPSFEYRGKVLNALKKLQKMIEEKVSDNTLRSLYALMRKSIINFYNLFIFATWQSQGKSV
jgi:hypothetical protein